MTLLCSLVAMCILLTSPVLHGQPEQQPQQPQQQPPPQEKTKTPQQPLQPQPQPTPESEQSPEKQPLPQPSQHPKPSRWPPMCPFTCSCEIKHLLHGRENVHTTDCANRDLNMLPNNISTDTEALLLSGNTLPETEFITFLNLPKLAILDVSANHIMSIEHWWIDIDSLKEVFLDKNGIGYFPNQTFIHLPNLEAISASHNNIEIIHPDAFYGLSYLRRLELSRNRIYEINPRWFEPLSSLEHLGLSENNVHVLQDGAFTPLSKLKTLVFSNNNLKHIHKGAFLGLENLKHLYLQENHLWGVPKAPLQVFNHLEILDLSKNHVDKFSTDAITNINTEVLKVNNMGMLSFIEEQAFVDLPFLKTLEITNNRALLYIDRYAFLDLPRVSTLHLHSNNLSTVEEDIVTGLPFLHRLSIHDNPLFCDCAVGWIRKEMETHAHNLTFDNEAQITCAYPDDLQSKKLQAQDIAKVEHQCAPRIIPLFVNDYNLVIGEKLELDCRAVGVPRPQIDWLLPAHRAGELNDDITFLKPGKDENEELGRVDVTQSGTLYIDYIQGTDSGHYTCLASNPKGRDERTLRLRVKTSLANILITRVTSSSITVTWQSVKSSHDYQIAYRQSSSNRSYSIVDIKPYMRYYTARQLHPATMYEFCIATDHNTRTLRLNCTLVSTRNLNFLTKGVISARGYIVGAVFAGSLILLVVACAVGFIVKRYNKRRRQQDELYGDNMSQMFLASMDSLSDTTPITYENRVAEIFDDDDIEEIRNSAANAHAHTRNKT